jgi:hypothetical protein
LIVLGSISRIFSRYYYFFALLGSFFSGAGQPFLQNCPAKVASYWFTRHDRPIATAILALINPIGTAFALLIPGLVVTSKDPE